MGERISYHWEDHGWCDGTVDHENDDEEITVDNEGEEMANFVVEYDIDEDLSPHLLSLDDYNPRRDAPVNSWYIISEPGRA